MQTAQRKSFGAYLLFFGKWLLLAVAVGLGVGAAGAAFAHALSWANAFRAAHPWVLYGLPLGGLLITALYRGAKNTADRGTNTILLAVRGEGETSLRTAPLIFVSTAITHLCGGSAGREGAALQLGGSLAGFLGKRLRASREDQRILIMCGMAAGFSALFGTPLAAAVFALEVACVGVVEYTALCPAVLCSMAAHFTAKALLVPPEVFPLAGLPAMTPLGLAQAVAVGAAAAGASVVFCLVLHRAEHLYQRVKSPYLRIFLAGVLVVALSKLLNAGAYLGSGMGILEEIFHDGRAMPIWSFLLKMLFTALTLGAGFKGGEIVPSFTVGAALGAALASWLGLPVELCAACCMTGVFCGVTNCPMTALLIAFELFGFEGMLWYLPTVAVSYLLSARHSLYHVQIFHRSKLTLGEQPGCASGTDVV